MDYNNKDTKTILLIDGYHLIHKGYYGSLKRTKQSYNKKGILVNALYTFIININKFINSKKYHTIIVAFDTVGGSWRKEQYEAYKAKRKEKPQELKDQIHLCKDYLTSIELPWYEKEQYEGDDVIATISGLSNFLGYNVEILSNDKDLYQLVNNHTKIITNVKKHEEVLQIGPKEVFEEFGCYPSQIADFKSLNGDSSDNIKGVVGLHKRTIIRLLDKYNNVENIAKEIEQGNLLLDNKKLTNLLSTNLEKILNNKKIVTLYNRLDLGKINLKPLRVDWRKAIGFLKEHNLRITIFTKKYQNIQKAK